MNLHADRETCAGATQVADATEQTSSEREVSVGRSSRLPGFYRKDVEERLSALVARQQLSEAALEHFRRGGGLRLALADLMSENVISTHGLPLSVALNFSINGEDRLVPMAVEEPSVVAAASNAALMVRRSGGFEAFAAEPVMTTQVQLDAVRDCGLAARRIEAARDELASIANKSIPSMVARGGGFRDLEFRALSDEEGIAVVHLYIDVRDAMGANLVDTVAEAVAPRIAELANGRVGLRILSNLPMHRTVQVSATVDFSSLVPGDSATGETLAHGIARASRFAELDIFRAVTHNKGIMNGVDAVAVALGQDWRSIEAGAHAFAALDGQYAPLATWRIERGALRGQLRMPMAVGTVGGSTRVSDGVRAAFELLAIRGWDELAMVMGAAGLASNLAALRALAGEGIQRGHMRLHARKSVAPGSKAKTQSRTGEPS